MRLPSFIRQLELHKELAKNLIVPAIIWFGGVVAFSLVNAAFSVDLSNVDWGKLVKEFWSGIVDRVPDYIDQHPLRAYGLFFFGVIISVFYRVLRHFVKDVRELRDELGKRVELLERVGLYGFRHHSTNQMKEENWSELQGHIDKPQNRALCILGATGWHTFGKKNSPLNDCLKNYTGHVRVLLIDPACLAAKQRAASINQNFREYQKEINGTLSFCTRLAEQGKSIEVRTYDQPPTWKLIITGTSLWVQHYRHSAHVDHSAVITMYPTQEQQGLYDAFATSFERLWSISKIVGAVPTQNGDEPFERISATAS